MKDVKLDVEELSIRDWKGRKKKIEASYRKLKDFQAYSYILLRYKTVNTNLNFLKTKTIQKNFLHLLLLPQ